MANKRKNPNDERPVYKICAECGKEFYKLSRDWTYKKRKGDKYIYCCSYGCFKKMCDRLEKESRSKPYHISGIDMRRKDF